MKRHEAVRVLTELHAAFPRQELSRNSTQVYLAHLLAFDAAEAQAAVRRLMVTARWFPSLAELVAAIDTRPPALEAWGSVLDAIRGSGRLPPEARDAVKAMGGFARLSNLQSRDVIAERARFCELYEQQARESRAERFALPAQTQPLRLRGAK